MPVGVRGVATRLVDSEQVGAVYVASRRLESAGFARLLSAASIRGLVGEISPGDPPWESWRSYTAAGEEH